MMGCANVFSAARHAVDQGADYGRDDARDCLGDADLALNPLLLDPW